MRSRTRDQVLNALPIGSDQVAEGQRVQWTPVVEGVELPDQPRALFESGTFARVPLMIGTNRDEGWVFVDRSFPAGLTAEQYDSTLATEFGADAAAVASMYGTPGGATPEEAAASRKATLAAIVGDAEYVCEARRIARLVERSGTPVFAYSFDYEIDPVAPDHVIHGLDNNLLFGNNFGAPSNSCPHRRGPAALSRDGRLLGEVRRPGDAEYRRRRRRALAGVQAPIRGGPRVRQASGARRAGPRGHAARRRRVRLLGAIFPAHLDGRRSGVGAVRRVAIIGAFRCRWWLERAWVCTRSKRCSAMAAWARSIAPGIRASIESVAIKILAPGITPDAAARGRLVAEARAASLLNHPNICALYDIGSHEATDFLVMELLEGETFAARLLPGPLPFPSVVRIGAEIAQALDAAHARGIVHRDLKPGNVMLTRTGAKLLDFGIATIGHPAVDGDDQRPSSTGTVTGTPPYMAPEQLEGVDVDSRADIFALGAVLYEMANRSQSVRRLESGRTHRPGRSRCRPVRSSFRHSTWLRSACHPMPRQRSRRALAIGARRAVSTASACR